MAATSFDSSGSEGMLDVILGCTLIFLLMTALVRVDEGKTQEIVLPPMDLSGAKKPEAPGVSSIKRTVISLGVENGNPQYFLDDELLSKEELLKRLANMGGAHVALRRDRGASIAWEDEMILACQEAGIHKIAIMVQTKEN